MEFARLCFDSGRGGGGMAMDLGDTGGVPVTSVAAPGIGLVEAVDEGDDAPPSLTMSMIDCRVGTGGLR